mmetsp:Transcript_98761/g.156168  ORF Transcript_98761/g.156168 Transcript_98761/m.156168 type:complete len:134 (+) Transcript_98761:65-466(+)
MTIAQAIQNINSSMNLRRMQQFAGDIRTNFEGGVQLLAALGEFVEVFQNLSDNDKANLEDKYASQRDEEGEPQCKRPKRGPKVLPWAMDNPYRFIQGEIANERARWVRYYKGSEHMYLGREPRTPPAFLEEGL